MAKGNVPDWTLSAMDPDNICKGKCGAAWNNDDGSISIKLNPFVVLEAVDGLRIRLFPAEGYDERQRQVEQDSAATPSKARKRTTPGYAGEPPDSDDIPF